METQVEIVQEYQDDALALEAQTKAIIIMSDEQNIVASNSLVDLKKVLNERESFFKPMVDAAFKAHRTVTGHRNLVCDPLKSAIRNLSDKVASYQYQQQLKRERQEAAAREEARRKEKARTDALLAKAEKEEAKGNTEKAEDLIEKAEEVYVAPKPVAAPVKTKTSVTVTYDVEILDIKKIPFNYLIVDESKLTRCKKADKSLEVPGIKFHPRAVGSTRSK